MKALVQILIFFSLTLQAQVTAIIPNLKLAEQEVRVELNPTQDPLLIKALSGSISKVSIIQRVNGDRSIRTAPLNEYKDNEYRIPMHMYRIVAYTE